MKRIVVRPGKVVEISDSLAKRAADVFASAKFSREDVTGLTKAELRAGVSLFGAPAKKAPASAKRKTPVFKSAASLKVRPSLASSHGPAEPGGAGRAGKRRSLEG